MSERIDVFIEAPNLDAQDIEFRLPVGVTMCWACRGNGKRKQWYCDAPSMTGPCDWCHATGFRHENSGAAVSPSVVNQIAVMNSLEVRHTRYGNDWSQP